MDEFKIEDYLSEYEIKNILKDVLRNKCESYLENNFERMVSNAAYHIVWESVDEVIDGSFKDQLKSAVSKQMSSFSEFHIFRKPDAWNREPNSAYKLLMESIEEHKHLLDERVKYIVNNLQPREDWQIDLDSRIEDLIMERLFKTEN